MSLQLLRTVELWYDDTPPSLNEFGSGDRRRWQREKKRWHKILTDLLMVEKVGPADWVEASAMLRFPRRANRDADNFTAPLAKYLGDALVAQGVLPDDNAERYRFAQCQLVVGGRAKTTIWLALHHHT